MSDDCGKEVVIIGVVALVVVCIGAYLFGGWSERARTARRVNEMKRQILDIAKKDA